MVAVKVGRDVEVCVKLMEVDVKVSVAVGKLVNVVVSEGVGEKKRVANASIVDHNYCHDTLGSSGGSRAGFQIKVSTRWRCFLNTFMSV